MKTFGFFWKTNVEENNEWISYIPNKIVVYSLYFSPHCECSLLCRNIRLVTRHFDKEIRAKLENLYAERFIMELVYTLSNDNLNS